MDNPQRILFITPIAGVTLEAQEKAYKRVLEKTYENIKWMVNTHER